MHSEDSLLLHCLPRFNVMEVQVACKGKSAWCSLREGLLSAQLIGSPPESGMTLSRKQFWTLYHRGIHCRELMALTHRE